jgi:hypothetical protein
MNTGETGRVIMSTIFNQPKFLGYGEGSGANITPKPTQMHWMRAKLHEEL